jgi:hypothetical protein
MKKSWKTSVAGIVTAIGLALSDNNDQTIGLIGKILACAGAFLTGHAARDNNVTSEDVGAK